MDFIFFVKQRQSPSRALFDAFIAPTLATNGHISVIAADFDLCAFLDKIAVAVDTGIDNSLVAAVACRFYFVDCVGYPSKRWLWKSVRRP